MVGSDGSANMEQMAIFIDKTRFQKGTFSRQKLDVVNMIYSAGRDCPICYDSSDIIFLKDKGNNQIFFACYACGCAWKQPRQWEGAFDIQTPKHIAPRGFEIATLSDIEASKLKHFICWEYSEILMKEISGDDVLRWLQ